MRSPRHKTKSNYQPSNEIPNSHQRNHHNQSSSRGENQHQQFHEINGYKERDTPNYKTYWIRGDQYPQQSH